MSKIGKLPIALASGTTVTVQGNQVQVAASKGNGAYTMPEGISAEVNENTLLITASNLEDRKVKAMYGLTRANIANLVKGLETGFEKKLELVGVGYRAAMQGTDLSLSLGFSHPVKIKPEPGTAIAVEGNTVTVSGTDKAVVGLVAARIRAVKPPEPYKGKGIKYKGEYIRRKAGKAAKAAGAK